MMTSRSYTLETPAPLWDGYDDLVPPERRYNDRIAALMTADVLAHDEQVPDETVAVAEVVLEESTFSLEVSDGAES